MDSSSRAESQQVDGYQFRFWFLNVRPVVWRRLLLRADQTLADLHYAIQICCNWSDDFLHQFKVYGKTISIPRLYGLSGTDWADEVRLADLQLRQNQRFLYEYNFCHWRHVWQVEIRVEQLCEVDSRSFYPRCIGGKRTAPPEDCGGAARFNELRDHFSFVYIAHRVLEWNALLERRDQLSEAEEWEYEERHREVQRFVYWLHIDKFDRREANRRLKQYAANDNRWRDAEGVYW